MAGNARPASPSDVHPDIDAIRRVQRAQHPLELAGEPHHLLRGGAGGLGETGNVIERDHQHVAAGVGIAVQYHEVVLGAMNDQSVAVAGFGR